MRRRYDPAVLPALRSLAVRVADPERSRESLRRRRSELERQAGRSPDPLTEVFG